MAAADADADAAAAPLEQTPPPAPKPPPPRVRVPDTGCLDPKSPRIDALHAQAKAWVQQSIEAELARRDLTIARLGGRLLHLHRGIDGPGQTSKRHRDGTVVNTTVENVTGNFIAGYSHWSGQATWPDNWEFVRDGDGVYFRLMRNGQPSARSMDIHVCACQPQLCGPYGSGCPACGSTTQIMYGPLPADARYGGEVTVTYDHPDVALHYARTDCPPHHRCPDPPPSSAR